MSRLVDLEQRFVAATDPKRAEQMSAYLHHQFPFYGVQTPNRRHLYRAIIATDKAAGVIDWHLLTDAWHNPYRELDYFVCDYLRTRAKVLTANDLPKLLPFLTSKQRWDTIDSFAPTLGKMAEQDKQVEQTLLEWSTADDIWLHRVAISHQLGRKNRPIPNSWLTSSETTLTVKHFSSQKPSAGH